jgi:hypothetical protein
VLSRRPTSVAGRARLAPAPSRRRAAARSSRRTTFAPPPSARSTPTAEQSECASRPALGALTRGRAWLRASACITRTVRRRPVACARSSEPSVRSRSAPHGDAQVADRRSSPTGSHASTAASAATTRTARRDTARRSAGVRYASQAFAPRVRRLPETPSFRDHHHFCVTGVDCTPTNVELLPRLPLRELPQQRSTP